MSNEIKKGFSMDFLKTIQIIPDNEPTPEEYEQMQEYSRKVDEEYQRQQEIKYLKSIGIGERYFEATLERYICNTPEQTAVLNKVKDFIQNYKKRTLWMIGNSGTGKTMLAAIICRECHGHYCKSYQIELALDDCKSFKAAKSKTEVIKEFSDYPLLVIDEVGKFESKEEIKYLFMIINERYEKNKSTVLITNKNKKELVEYLGQPIFDRFTENCMSIEFNFNSYRINKREEM